MEILSFLVTTAKNLFSIAKDAKDLTSKEPHKKEPGSRQKPQLTEFERLQTLYSNSEKVYWAVGPDGNKLGPFCPYCLIIDGHRVPLNRGATRGTYSCPLHQENFTTQEYNGRPVRRRRFRWPTGQ